MIKKEIFIEILEILQDSGILDYYDDKQHNTIAIESEYADLHVKYDNETNYIVNPRMQKLQEQLTYLQGEVKKVMLEIQELEEIEKN